MEKNNEGHNRVPSTKSKNCSCTALQKRIDNDIAPFYPIPNRTTELLSKSPTANFSLCFPRLTQWIESGDVIKKTEPNPKKGWQGTIEQLREIANKNMPCAANVLKRYQQRQKAYLRRTGDANAYSVCTVDSSFYYRTRFRTSDGNRHDS